MFQVIFFKCLYILARDCRENASIKRRLELIVLYQHFLVVFSFQQFIQSFFSQCAMQLASAPHARVLKIARRAARVPQFGVIVDGALAYH